MKNLASKEWKYSGGVPVIVDFYPLTGQPQMAVGAMSKEGFLQAIKDVLKV